MKSDCAAFMHISFVAMISITMRRFILFTVFSVLITQTNAQTYFQQEVKYKIDVSLNDREHSLSGHEEFEYINNSSNSLDYILIHLWPNAYKNAKTAMSKQQFEQGNFFMLWAGDKSKGYIDSLDFRIDGQSARWEYYKDYQDIAIVYLEKSLLPGGSIKVSTPFYVKLPSGSISRLGHVGESYQITQWYPKPAVYDKQGWHEMPYLTQGEFYSEFGSYDVSITLPDNYVVGATGDLQTSSEIEWLNKAAEKPAPAPTIYSGEGKSGAVYPPSSSKMKTLRYTQSNVHDFAWFADKRWIVRKGEVELPHSKRKVTTWAMFTPENQAGWEATGIKSINDALYYYSLWSGDYPYDVCTAVDGTISAGGGMEYPNVTVIGNSGGEQTLKTVIVHEVGHNWFYGILGSNERDNAWMDEGINSFFETRTMLATGKPSGLAMVGIEGPMARKIKMGDLSYQYLTEELPYILTARGEKDQPIQMPSEYFTSMNYGTIVYKKTALAFNYLMNYLGEEKFNACMAAYFDAWKFRHPTPADIQAVFEQTSGKDLSWFFDEVIPTIEHIDYSACSIRMRSDGAEMKVKNSGDIPAPFSVEVIRDGKTVSTTWFEAIPVSEKGKVKIAAQKGDLVRINNLDGIPEIYKKDNNLRTSGILRRIEPLDLSPFTGVENPYKTQLFWLPMVAWNEHNKWMPGIALHNKTIPGKKLTWTLAPLFSISSQTFNGFASIGYDNGKVSFGVRGRRFGLGREDYDLSTTARSYHVIAPYVRAVLFPRRLKKDWSGDVGVTMFNLTQMIRYEDSPLFGEYTYVHNPFTSRNNVVHLRMHANIRKTFPRSEFLYETSFEGGDYTDYAVFQQHSMSFKWVYRGKGKKRIYTRIYFGQGEGFYLGAAGQYGGYRYDAQSPRNQIRSDYAFEGLFLGRDVTDGLLSQQFMRTQGGLAAPTQQTANKSLFSWNAEIDLPVKFPVRVYGGLALLRNDKDYYTHEGQLTTNDNQRTLWNVGVNFPIIPDVLKIYMPLMYSSSIRDEVKARDLSFGQQIMFELKLDAANPFNIVKKIGG